MIETMHGDQTDWADRLRLSSWWVVGGSVVAGLTLFLLTEMHYVPMERTKALGMILVLYLMAGLIGLIDLWQAWAARWLTILFSVCLIQAGMMWFAGPGWFALFPLPAILALALVSVRAGIGVAIVEALLLLLGVFSGLFVLDLAALLLTLTGCWLTLAVAIALYFPWQTLYHHLWHEYEHARQLLETERDRNANLEEVRDELLHTNRQSDLLNERLAAMRLLAEEAQRAKAAFVAKVSHEFRTPLNMIIGLIDLLVETPTVYGEKLPPALFHDLEIVHRNCTHLASMIDDVLNLSQAEAGRLTLHKAWVDLSEDIYNALAVVEPLLQKKHLRLEVCLPCPLPMLYCDRTRIRQVILNLLSNAARYTEAGGIIVKAVVEQDDVIFSVTDTGPGITYEEVSHIFEPFYQAKSAHGLAQRGSGLGLTISKQFVELHDGKLWVESQPNVGSTFFFKLHIAPAPAPVTRPERWIQEEWMWLEGRARPPIPRLPHRPRIVVCDRWGELRHWCEHGCHSQEFEFVETQSLAQAIQACHACPAHLLMINAPMAELWALVEAARQAAPDTLIVGNALPSPREAILAKGALDYLMKPVTRADVVEMLQSVDRPVRRILLVDDDVEVRELLARMLLAHDSTLQIDHAENGAQALAALDDRVGKPLPDLVLLDMLLPDKTGLQLLEEKQLLGPMIAAIPVVVISAQDPGKQPHMSDALVMSMVGGLPFEKAVRTALTLSTLLLSPAAEPGRE